ncbi:phenylalanine--tRNA ligase subunit beta [Chloroflexota bacterium]
MKVSLNWLKDYVDITVPVETIAEKLTMAGFEVNSIEVIGESWDNVIIGQITAVNPHPNADRLTLPTVDLGTEQTSVVCGAPNLNIGDKVPYARVGARLIDGHSGKTATLKPAKIRGVDSSGMICSEKELGISDRHEGILVLADDAPVGTPLVDYMGDTVINLDVTPNRPDCLSIIGIAREIAALTGQKIHIPEISYKETGAAINDRITIEINAPDLCPRYSASLITGVKTAESPAWMQQRLLACGQRPISNIVDVTNYVMLEYGQPLHSFDYEKLRGKKIVVRRASDYEPMTTLDDNERELNSSMLVITDPMGAVAVAGVMGGANTEVTENTTSILLEAASFNPASIHYTGRTLNLPSEACMRFERGISAGITMSALRRATQLIAQLGEGEVAEGIIDVYPGEREPEPILISTAEVKRCLGVEYSLEQITKALTLLGFECNKPGSAEEISVISPYWRSDIRWTVDLIEEVARILDYDSIPLTMLSEPIPRQNPDPVIGLKRGTRRLLAGYGFQELVTYTLTSMEMITNLLPETGSPELKPLRLHNPMTSEQEYLRPNLRANLLTALSSNRKHEDGGIRIYEVGKIYIPRPGELPEERDILCGLISGPWIDKSWKTEGELPDFFEAKGIVEGLLGQLKLTASFEQYSDESLISGKQAAVVVDSNRIGVVGEVHPKVCENFEIAEHVYLFEIDMAALLLHATGDRMYRPIYRFPAMVRDMALVTDTGITHQMVMNIIKSSPLVTEVSIFDVYSGEQVPPGKKSLAYRLTFQSPDHTLTDKEVNKVEKQILDRLSKDLGATLRA